MKKPVLIFCMILSLFSITLRAQARCEITEYQITGKLKKRTRVIRFPDSREIILVGHSHGDRDVPIRISSLAKADSKALSNQGFRDGISAILKDNSLAVEHIQQDTWFLRSLLQKNPDIKFVAIEATQAKLESNLEYFYKLRERFQARLSQRNIPASVNNHRALLLATGPVNHLKIQEPGLFNGRILLGPESESADEAYDKALSEFDSARDRLKALAAGDAEFLKKISDTYGELMGLYPNYDPKTHDALILDAVQRGTPSKYQPAADEWIRAGLTEMNAMKARDRAIAESMTKRNDSGVFFVGLWHLESIALMVQKQCLENWRNTENPTTSEKLQ